MTAVPEDWEDVVETLRRDLAAVSNGDAEDGDVRDAIDEVWAIVDTAEERIGSVDPEQIGDVLGVGDGDADAIDVESISREFVLDDPQRAAGLSRLVALVNVDEATGYDVGRLWSDEEDAPVESAGDGPGEGADQRSRSTEQGQPDRSTDGAGGAIREELGDALSELRDRIREAREGTDESADSGPETDDDGGTEEESDRDGTSSKRRSTQRRGSGTLSTIPSRRRDMDGPAHLSTMPRRNGR